MKKKERDWKFIIGMVVLIAIFAVMGGAFWNMVGEQAQLVKEEEQQQEANAIPAIYIELTVCQPDIYNPLRYPPITASSCHLFYLHFV